MKAKFALVLLALSLTIVVGLAMGSPWPKQYSVRGSDVGATDYTLAKGQPIGFDLQKPAGFYLAIGATGGYRIPVRYIDMVADGDGVTFKLFAVSSASAWADSIYVYSLGEADSLRIYGK